jgi:hypothetical protein
MNWVVLLSVLAGWLLLGLAVAYLFGRFIRGAESPDNAGDLIPPVVTYLRRNKRVKTASRARVPSQAQPKARRETATRH